MSDVDRLREVIATMLLMPQDQITRDTSLKSLESSLSGTRLRLALKRAGLDGLCANGVPATYGALEAALTDIREVEAPREAGLTTIGVMESPPANLLIGIDIQQVTELPEAIDYCAHEMYRKVFAGIELAYAVANSDPRLHLAGFWCAKEALRKCDPSFLKADLTTTAVGHNADGRPYLCMVTPLGARRLPHAVSISHSGIFATAVVIVQRRGASS